MTSFGPALRDLWRLNPAVTYLNHGTVGAPPLAVLQAQRRLRDHIERQPAQALFREVGPQLRAAADRVGAFLRADGDDLVFVDNTTSGVNAVLRSLPAEVGDTVVLTSLGYGSFPGVAEFIAQQRGLRVHTIDLPFPAFDPQRLVEAFEAGLPDTARLAVVDLIASATGMRLPIEAIAKICRERGIWLLVDGAHAPGHIDLDIAAIGADLFVGNLHKWMFTPRSSAILWARKDHQPWLHPPVMSWGLGQGFCSEFDQVGTRDPTPHLCAPAALDWIDSMGFDAIRNHNHRLAVDAGELLARAWETEPLLGEPLVANLVPARLPARIDLKPDGVAAFRDMLFHDHHIEVHVACEGGLAWVRVGAQIYNDIADVQRLADVVSAL